MLTHCGGVVVVVVGSIGIGIDARIVFFLLVVIRVRLIRARDKKMHRSGLCVQRVVGGTCGDNAAAANRRQVLRRARVGATLGVDFGHGAGDNVRHAAHLARENNIAG